MIAKDFFFLNQHESLEIHWNFVKSWKNLGDDFVNRKNRSKTMFPSHPDLYQLIWPREMSEKMPKNVYFSVQHE